MPDLTPLDNPIWNALTSEHQALARINGLARRYPSDVSPLTGLAAPSAAAFADLAALVAPEEKVALFTPAAIDVPSPWQVVRSLFIDQMVCVEPVSAAPSLPIVPLVVADVPEMLELTALAEPGPFLPRTITMGHYFGIRSPDGRLIAMAGERLRLSGFTEISAVCTHPDFRGQGYSRSLVAMIAAMIRKESRIPFLHVKTENAAKSVYKKAGFAVRWAMCVTVVTRD